MHRQIPIQAAKHHIAVITLAVFVLSGFVASTPSVAMSPSSAISKTQMQLRSDLQLVHGPQGQRSWHWQCKDGHRHREGNPWNPAIKDCGESEVSPQPSIRPANDGRQVGGGITQISKTQCASEGRVLSREDGSMGSMTFFNRGAFAMIVYRIGVSGRKDFAKKVEPGAEGKLQGWVGSYFVIKDTNKNCIGFVQQTQLHQSGEISPQQGDIATPRKADVKPTGVKPADGTPSAEEMQLYNLINSYRQANGRPAIPLSAKLTRVAQLHAKDTSDYPDSTSLHSWSTNGNWTAGTFTYGGNSELMWNKPREISGYQSNGFEVSSMSSARTPQSHLDNWKQSTGHNTVILQSSGYWKQTTFKAMGVGIYGDVAHVWFGEIAD